MLGRKINYTKKMHEFDMLDMLLKCLDLSCHFPKENVRENIQKYRAEHNRPPIKLNINAQNESWCVVGEEDVLNMSRHHRQDERVVC